MTALLLSRLQALSPWPARLRRNRYTWRGRIMRAIRYARRPWAIVLPPWHHSCKVLQQSERTYRARGCR